MRGCGEPEETAPRRPSPRQGGCSGSRGRPSHSGRERRARPRPHLPVLTGGLALRHRSVRSLSGRGWRRGRARSLGEGRWRRHGTPATALANGRGGPRSAAWSLLASRGLQIPQGHAAGTLPRPRVGRRQPRIGHHPAWCHRLSRTHPWKTINKHLLDTVIFNTYS